MTRGTLHAMGGGPRRLAALFVIYLFSCAAAPAFSAPGAIQKKDEPEEVPETDPYSEEEPELLEALGYESFGPFAFGDGHRSDEVHRILGEIPMLWVETEHFRIGSTLADYTVAEDQDERAKIKAELKRLKKKLPKVKPSVRELDRWLLLHLWAQRMEELYARYSERIGVEDADFKPPRSRSGPPMGGPYLGQAEKFTVLLLQKQSGLGRYTSHFLQRESRFSLRWYFHGAGTMFFGIAFESMKGTYANDTALHCAVANGVANNFVDGFRSYAFQTPVWWTNGVAHELSREVDPRFNVYGGGLGSHGQDEDGWNWEPRVKARVKHDYYPSFEDMFGWAEVGAMKDPDHMMAWSRVQFLLQDPEATKRFMIALKEPFPRGADETAALIERQRELIPECWGESLEELEAGWAKWVKKNYKRK